MIFFVPLALHLSSFHQPENVYFLFLAFSLTLLYALNTKSLQNITVQLYTENITQ